MVEREKTVNLVVKDCLGLLKIVENRSPGLGVDLALEDLWERGEVSEEVLRLMEAEEEASVAANVALRAVLDVFWFAALEVREE
jgi:hypothetical protein